MRNPSGFCGMSSVSKSDFAFTVAVSISSATIEIRSNVACASSLGLERVPKRRNGRGFPSGANQDSSCGLAKAWDRHRVAGHLILKATCESQTKTHSSLTSRNSGLLLAMGRALAAAMAARASRGSATSDEVAFGGIAGVHRKGAGRPARAAQSS
jgi:hypothetical protein